MSEIKQYFKVKMISIKKDGIIKVIDKDRNEYKMERMRYPFLRMRDVFEGQVVTDMTNGMTTVLYKKLLTDDDNEVIVATFPPKTPEEIKTP